MTNHNRTGRINVRLLILLGLVFSIAATGVVIAHTMRKRMNAKRSLVAAKAAYAAGDWETAGREYRAYLGKFNDDMDAMMKFAQAELNIHPARPDTLGSAINAYRKVLRTRPGDKDLCDRLARLYLAVGDYTNVRYVANQRLSVDGHDTSAMTWMGKAMLAQHQHADLEQELGKFVDEKESAAVPVYVLLAKSAIQSGDARGPQQALDALGKAVRNSPSSAEALARRAQLLLVSGNSKDSKRIEQARADLEAADALNPEEGEARLLLADAWLTLNRPDRAQIELAAAQKLPLAPRALYDFEREQSRVAFLQTAGRLALLTGDRQQTLILADQGMSELTLDRRMQFIPMAAQLYIAGGQAEKARDLLKEYHAAADEQARGNKQLAEQLALLDAQLANAQSRPYEALSELQGIVSVQDVSDPMVYREIGYGYMRTNQDRRAAEALEKYVSLKQEDFRALVALAWVHYRNLDWAKTLKYAELALRLNQKEDIDARVLSIDAILRGGKGVKPSDSEVEGFAEELRTLHEKYPRRVDVRILEAQIATLQKGHDAAIAILRQATKECDAPLSAALQVVDHLNSQNKRDEAMQACREAIQQTPDSAQPRTVLAALQFNAGQKDEARKTLEEASTSLKGDEAVAVQLTLAGNSLAVGKRDKASADRERGLAMLRKLAADHPGDIRPRLQLLEQEEVQKNVDPGRNEPQDLVDDIKKIEGERGIRWRYEQARVLLRGDWKAKQDYLIENLTKSVEGDPAWASAVLLLGGVYELLNKDSQAEDVYRRFVENYPDNTAVISQYLTLLERQGKFAQASQILDRLPNAKDLSSHKSNIDIGQGRYEEAIKDLEKQTEEKPKDATTRVLLARLVYQQTKDAPRALALLDEAQKLAPDLLSVVSIRVVILEASGKKDEALAVLNAEVQRRNDFSAYLLRAGYFAAAGRLADAEKDYEHLTTFPTSVAEGYLRLGTFYERTQQPDKAIAAYEAGYKVDPAQLKKVLTQALILSSKPEEKQRGRKLLDEMLSAPTADADVKMIQAQAFLNEGTFESRSKAMDVLETVVQLSPRNIRAHIQLIRFASAQGDLAKATQLADRGLGANPDSPELLLLSAGIATDQENYVRARELVQSVLKLDPANLAAMNLMVRLCIQLNDLKVAEEQNAAILQKFPDDESAHLTQAEIAAKKEQPGEAVRLLEEFRKTGKGEQSVQAAMALTDLYRQRKEYPKCDQLLQEIEKAEPENFNAFALRLQVLAEQQKFDEFFKQLDARLASRPKEGQTLNAVATILSTVNAPAELDRAKPFFTRFIAQNSNDITAQIAMAMLAYRTLDMKGAQEAYQAALKIDPYNLRALNNLAWILSEERGQYEDALKLANTAVVRYERDPLVLNTRGVILFRLNRLREAKQDLERCLEMTNVPLGTQARTLAFLARIAIRNEDPRESRRLFEKALEIDRKNKVLTTSERADIEKSLGITPSRPAFP